jgi:hypothetical protein
MQLSAPCIWQDFGSVLPFQTCLTQTKPVLPLSNKQGSQVNDQGQGQCCHNKHKKSPYRTTRDVPLLSGHTSYYRPRILKISLAACQLSSWMTQCTLSKFSSVWLDNGSADIQNPQMKCDYIWNISTVQRFVFYIGHHYKMLCKHFIGLRS